MTTPVLTSAIATTSTRQVNTSHAATAIIGLAAGGLFALGLWISGMNDPQTVLRFLTLDAAWNPALMWVMIGAIPVAMPFFWWAKQRQAKGQASLSGQPIQLPTRRDVDGRLILGAAMFGAGWGLSGICPAPALFDMMLFEPSAWIFGLTMLVGFWLATRLPG